MVDLSLDKVRKSPAVSVSGGERRKLKIARTLASHPSFVLLDEHICSKNLGIGVIIIDHNVPDTLPNIIHSIIFKIIFFINKNLHYK